MNGWLDKSFSPREKQWISKLQIFKKNYVKVALALAFFAGAWWYEGSWIVALTLLIAVYGHELGHLWAMRSVGMESHGMWFIPFFGGVAVPQQTDSEANNWERWLVVIMGPLWGFAMALVPFLIYQYALENRLRDQFFEATKADRAQIASFAVGWMKVARDVAILNLVNLLPLPFLDGGRMIGEMILSFRRKTATVLLAIFLGLAGWMLLRFGSVWLVALSCLGVVGLWLRWQQKEPNGEMYKAEMVIAIFFHLGLLLGLLFISGSMSDEIWYWERVVRRSW